MQVFLGTLRDIEMEMIKDRLSSAVMESLLALTVFREEFGAYFIAMFTSLVFVKVLHWLVQNRVEFIEVRIRLGSWCAQCGKSKGSESAVNCCSRFRIAGHAHGLTSPACAHRLVHDDAAGERPVPR